MVGFALDYDIGWLLASPACVVMCTIFFSET